MATKRRKTKSRRRKSRRRSRKSCKYGKLKRKVKTKSGRKRRCKKKRNRTYKMRSLKEISQDVIRRSEMLENVPGGFIERREVVRRNLPQSMLFTELMNPARLSDMPDEMSLQIFENSDLTILSNLYYTNEKMRNLAIDIVKRRYTQEEKDNELISQFRSTRNGRDRLKIGTNTVFDTPHLTSIIEKSRVIKLLLDSGANPNVKYNRYRNTLLMLASLRGIMSTNRSNCVDDCIGKQDPITLEPIKSEMDNTSELPYHPVMIDKKCYNYKSLNEALQHRPEIPHNREPFTTPELILTRAYTSNNECFEVVKELLRAGANPNMKNSYGFTALMFASEYGHTKIVKLLLEGGANPNIKNNMSNFDNYMTPMGQPFYDWGWTALMYASAYGHTEIVDLLLQGGADPNIREVNQRLDRPGKTAAQIGNKEWNNQTRNEQNKRLRSLLKRKNKNLDNDGIRDYGVYR